MYANSHAVRMVGGPTAEGRYYTRQQPSSFELERRELIRELQQLQQGLWSRESLNRMSLLELKALHKACSWED